MNLNTILISSANPADLLNFYKKVLGKNPDWQGEEGQFAGFQIGSGFLAIGPHDQIHGKNLSPARIMFNLETDDVADEFERIKKTGAKVIQEPYHPSEDSSMLLATFADPDDNYFQLASPMKE